MIKGDFMFRFLKIKSCFKILKWKYDLILTTDLFGKSALQVAGTRVLSAAGITQFSFNILICY